jgi:hypothetical protein
MYGLPFSYMKSVAVVIKQRKTNHDTTEWIILGFSLAWYDVSLKDLWEGIGISLALIDSAS